MGGVGPLRGLHGPSLFTAPKGEREGREWTEGWIGMPVEDKKNDLLQLPKSGMLTVQRVVSA